MYDNLGRLDEALTHHKLAYELSCRSGNLSNVWMICGNFACNRIAAGDLQDADRSLLQGLQLVGAFDEFGAHVGTLQVRRTLCLCHLGRYAEAPDQAERSVVSMQRHQIGRLNDARLRLASCWWHLGQWSRQAQVLGTVVLDAQTLPAIRSGHARLRWHCARAVTAGSADTAAARQRLEAALAAMVDGERPDLQLPLLIELTADQAPADAMRQLDAVCAEATRLGHQGPVLAPRVRSRQWPRRSIRCGRGATPWPRWRWRSGTRPLRCCRPSSGCTAPRRCRRPATAPTRAKWRPPAGRGSRPRPPSTCPKPFATASATATPSTANCWRWWPACRREQAGPLARQPGASGTGTSHPAGAARAAVVG